MHIFMFTWLDMAMHMHSALAKSLYNAKYIPCIKLTLHYFVLALVRRDICSCVSHFAFPFF